MSKVTRRLTNKQTVDPVKRLFEDLNQPSEARLKTALRAKGIPFTNEQVAIIVKGSASRQIFAPRQRFVGKVTSTAPNARWAADMVVLTSTPSKGGQKYILAVQDIWSRKFFTVALVENTPSAVATAFRIILGEAGAIPQQLNTDQGAEFTSGAFPRLLDEKGIEHRLKDPRDSNALATLDRAIQTLRVSLMKTGSTEDWADRLTRVTRGMNNAPHEHLLGEAPNSVPSNKQLQFHLQKQAAYDLQHNHIIRNQRERRLEESGAYRIQEKPKKFERSFHPRYGDTVHTLAKIEDGQAVPTDGARHNPKFVLPVPRGSSSVRTGPFARGGSAQVEAKKRSLLEPFAKKVVRHIGRGNDMELWRVGEFMKKQRNFNDKAREAGINMKSKIANFLRAFPELFTVTTPSAGGEATVTVAS